MHTIPLPKTDTQTDADTGGYGHQKRQGVEVRIQVRHREELPQPARPHGGKRTTGGPRRLEDCSIAGLGRKTEGIMFGAAPITPIRAWGLLGSEEGGGSLTLWGGLGLTFWYGGPQGTGFCP